ncbi:hypothetical protein [Mycobacterium nebraskense]|uniref:hypothetical protein n=1 Tax=Mycobacterium nebraskense TaxID=244292 RepID=UPI000A64FD5D|nr:hypothetical protein [Mycobacterium nebraskense]MBI2697485.1 hypothetical protein [Mycobacterium nebraskense]MCV7118964.1 hypothetical protein [Mycobacterium nebraskense]
MNQSAFGRFIGLLRKKQPAPARLVVVNETPPERSVELLWTGPGLGSLSGEGL